MLIARLAMLFSAPGDDAAFSTGRAEGLGLGLGADLGADLGAGLGAPLAFGAGAAAETSRFRKSAVFGGELAPAPSRRGGCACVCIPDHMG